MKVFVGGATGYIGAAVAKALLARGHSVVGGARSDAAAAKLEARGIVPCRVSLDDPATFAVAATSADAFVQVASASDATSASTEPKVAHAVVTALSGSGKVLVLTSGVWVYGVTGEGPATETTPTTPLPLTRWRPPVENEVLAMRGARGIVIRPGVVYGDRGGIPGMFADDGARHGTIRLPGDGTNRWSVVHLDDLGDLYAHAVEHPTATGIFNGTTGEAITVGEVGHALGKNLGIPVAMWPLPEARQTLGLFGDAIAVDQVVRSPRSKDVLGWAPHRASLAQDLATGSYV